MSSEIEANRRGEKIRADGGWITNEFLQRVISNHEKDKGIRVVRSDVCAPVGVGDNYLSILYQVNVDFVRGNGGSAVNRKLIIKGLPTAKVLLHMVEEYDFFRKERYVYNVCLPAMRRLMEEYMPEETDFIAASSYECSSPDAIVLEDLKIFGYKMTDRRKQMDFRHGASALRSLARFHALSFKLVSLSPEVIEEVSLNEFYTDTKTGSVYANLVKALKSWLKVLAEQEATRELVPVMKRVTENFMDKIIRAVKVSEGSFSTINHGDSWTNNFLFKYDGEGNVVHAKMVDFQIARYASPALDLLYLMFSSFQPDMLSESIGDFIKIYHRALASDLEKLRVDPSDIPSLEDIHREMRDRSIFGVVSVMVVTPLVTAKTSDAFDFESVDWEEMQKSEDYVTEKSFRDVHYQRLLVKYVAILEKMGYLRSAENLLVDKSEEKEKTCH